MRTKTMIAAALAAGVVGAGVLVTPVVLAADDQPTDQPYGPRWTDDDSTARGPMSGLGNRGQGPGNGQAQGRGGVPGMGHGMGPGAGQGMGPGAGQGMRGDGDCLLADGAAQGELTDAQKATVAENAETEKLSHDLYVAFFEQTGDYRFERVAQAETKHLEALQMLMDRYDIADPTEGLDEGDFASDSVQKSYDAYLEDGSASLKAALSVAADYEREDVAALEKFAAEVDAADVDQVFEHLADGSRMHLQAFSR